MLAAAGGIYGLTSSPVFGLGDLRIEGSTLTTDDAVRSALAVRTGANLVTLDTAELVDRVERLPTVRTADVSVGLPGTLLVRVVDRAPIVAWAVGDRRLLVDVDGRVIDELAAAAPLPDPTLPVVDDRRASAAAIGLGGVLDPIDLDAARRLGSLRPADVGSAASSLDVAVDDKDGFTLLPAGGGWTAVFGFYTPSLRTTEMIPGQVRLLRSLIAGREGVVARVVLASETDGTFVPRATPKPSPGPSPSPKP
jgi:hypothetical protein